MCSSVYTIKLFEVNRRFYAHLRDTSWDPHLPVKELGGLNLQDTDTGHQAQRQKQDPPPPSLGVKGEGSITARLKHREPAGVFEQAWGGGGDEAAGLIRGFVPLAKVLTGTASPPSAWTKLFDLHLPHFRGPCCSNSLQQSVEYADYASFALQSILAAPPHP